jgi:hypothetical protein
MSQAMKKQTVGYLFALIGIVAFSFSCQNKKVNPTEPGALERALWGNEIERGRRTITGTVKDLVTGLEMPNVTVFVIDSSRGLDTTVAVGTTDITGRFEIPGIPISTFLVYFTKSGYVDATVTAYVRQAYWSVDIRTTFLVPIGPKAVIGASGGNVIDTDEEGDAIRLDIPPGALDSDVEITVNHLQGVEVPSYPPRGRLSIATVHFEPEGTVFHKPVKVTIPLPQQMTPGVEMPLYSTMGPKHVKWQEVKWQDTGIKARVNGDGLTASSEINHFSTISVMPEVQVTETAVDTLWEQYALLPSANGYFTVMYKNQVEDLVGEYIYFPDGAEGLNKSTIVYMYEQFYGASFQDPLTETVYYQSTTGVYPFQVVRGVTFMGEMILSDPTRIVNAIKCVKRPMIVLVAHDQGCAF